MNFKIDNLEQFSLLEKLESKYTNLSITEGWEGKFKVKFGYYTHLDIIKDTINYKVLLCPRTKSDGKQISFREAVIKINELCKDLEVEENLINTLYENIIKDII